MARTYTLKKVLSPGIIVLGILLLIAIAFSIITIARATAPNPGHLFSDSDVNIVTKSTTATLLPTETVVLADGTSAAFTLTLPTAAAAAPHTIFIIKKTDTALANLITIVPSGADTIDGLTSVSLAQRGESLMIEADGVTTWRVLNRRDFDISGFRTRGSTLNQWYTSPVNGTALTTGAPTIGTLRAIPFVVSKLTTIDQMAISVTTVGVASNARVGIYNDNGNNYPGTLVVDAGSVVTTATGVKTFTTGLPVTLDPGLYWLVHTCDGSTTANIRTFTVSSLNPVLGYASTLPTNAQFGWAATLAFGALPATYPASAAVITAIPIPAIFVRTSI